MIQAENFNETIIYLIEEAKNAFASNRGVQEISEHVYLFEKNIQGEVYKFFGLNKEQQYNLDYDYLRRSLLMQLDKRPNSLVMEIIGDSAKFDAAGSDFAKEHFASQVKDFNGLLLYGYTGQVDQQGLVDVNGIVNSYVDKNPEFANKVIANIVDFDTRITLGHPDKDVPTIPGRKGWGAYVSRHVKNFFLVWDRNGAVFGDDTFASDKLVNSKALLYAGGMQSFEQATNILNYGYQVVGVSGIRGSNNPSTFIRGNGYDKHVALFEASLFFDKIKDLVSKKADVLYADIDELKRSYVSEEKKPSLTERRAFLFNPFRDDADLRWRLWERGWDNFKQKHTWNKVRQYYSGLELFNGSLRNNRGTIEVFASKVTDEINFVLKSSKDKNHSLILKVTKDNIVAYTKKEGTIENNLFDSSNVNSIANTKSILLDKDFACSYWFSFIRRGAKGNYKLELRLGRGEKREETSICLGEYSSSQILAIEDGFSTWEVYGNNINNIEYDNRAVRAHPLLIKENISPRSCSENKVIPPSFLSKECKELYGLIKGDAFNLSRYNKENFIFVKAIEESLKETIKPEEIFNLFLEYKNKGIVETFEQLLSMPKLSELGWCYKKLLEKAGSNANNKAVFIDNYNHSYLRITLGKADGRAPGNSFVLEIWPSSHISRVHNHANANGIIRVLHGQINVKLYRSVSTVNATHFAHQIFEKDDVTWLTEEINQVHTLENTEEGSAITIQCYRYTEGHVPENEEFVYIDGTSLINGFEPVPDSTFGDFLQAIMQERQIYYTDEQKQKTDSSFVGLQQVYMPGDGNCFYNAVGVYVGKTAQELRDMVAAALEKDISQHREKSEYFYIINSIRGDINVMDYIKGIKNKEWADDLEITILSKVLKRPISIIEKEHVKVIGDEFNDIGKMPIYVYYNGTDHYDGLLLVNNDDGSERLFLREDGKILSKNNKQLDGRANIILSRDRSNDILFNMESAYMNYICPIGLELMEDPVLAADGFSYDRKNIEAWFKKTSPPVTSPITGEPLRNEKLQSNRVLKTLIDLFKETQLEHNNWSKQRDTSEEEFNNTLQNLRCFLLYENLNQENIILLENVKIDRNTWDAKSDLDKFKVLFENKIASYDFLTDNFKQYVSDNTQTYRHQRIEAISSRQYWDDLLGLEEQQDYRFSQRKESIELFSKDYVLLNRLKNLLQFNLILDKAALREALGMLKRKIQGIAGYNELRKEAKNILDEKMGVYAELSWEQKNQEEKLSWLYNNCSKDSYKFLKEEFVQYLSYSTQINRHNDVEPHPSTEAYWYSNQKLHYHWLNNFHLNLRNSLSLGIFKKAELLLSDSFDGNEQDISPKMKILRLSSETSSSTGFDVVPSEDRFEQDNEDFRKNRSSKSPSL